MAHRYRKILKRYMKDITRIEVSSTVADTRAAVLHRRFTEMGFDVRKVSVVDAYTFDCIFTKKEVSKIASLLVNPTTHKATINRPDTSGFYSWVIEVGFLPGVTDNVAHTAKEMIEDALKKKFTEKQHVYTSQKLLINGKLTKSDVERIAGSLYNCLIQRSDIKDYRRYRTNGVNNFIPRVVLTDAPEVTRVNLDIVDDELSNIGKDGIENSDGSRRGPLALDLPSMQTIQSHFQKLGRNPTDVELESIAQTWSEHCKHTIMNSPIDEIEDGLFYHYIKRATDEILRKKKNFCASVFIDNSGAIVLDKNYLITHKVETHNSPSALDPFGGAMTGIVGVNRDAIGFGLGAKPIANTYGFCFADPKDATLLYRGKEFKQPMLPPKRILEGVVAGVNSGGNCSGIPTPQGFVYFDHSYKGKPLVFVGTVGLIPIKFKGKKLYVKKAKPGDNIVMIGGRVGIDGIHGATFSSESLNSGSPATAVQIGDPITQKKLSDALVKEARDLLLFTSITDNGAGGLSCSVAEMAKESGGCIVYLEKVPLKYSGLSPWQIWISESQERMTLAVSKKKWKKFFRLMKRRGVEATVIGKFTKDRRCKVYYNDTKVMDLSMEFLHNGLPKKHLITKDIATTMSSFRHKTPRNGELNDFFLKMLSRINIASYEFISMQYDHEVQGASVLKPLQGKGRVNGDATVIKPLFQSNKGVAISQGFYPRYSDIDSYAMAAASIDTAIRNLVCVGADPEKIALLDNFCWCSSNDPDRLTQLKLAAQACYDIAISYGTPFISGKDSMFNDFHGFDQYAKQVSISILPTLLISSVGIVPNVQKVVSLDAKFSGDLVYLLGETKDELGGSEYYSLLGDDDNIASLESRVPTVNAKQNFDLYKRIFKAIGLHLIASAQSVGLGGLAAAFAKTLIGGKFGFEGSLTKLKSEVNQNDSALFSESQGRILVTVDPKNKKHFETLFKNHTCVLLGTVVDNGKILVKGLDEETIISTSVDQAMKQYKKTFADF